MNTLITQHAEVRMQQRGVSPQVLDLLLLYGRRARAGKGAEIVYFDRKARNRLKGNPELKEITRDSKQLKSYAVCKGAIVVTAGKLYRRVRR